MDSPFCTTPLANASANRFLILGAGFTGGRVADQLARSGFAVISTHRDSFDAERGDYSRLLPLIEPSTVVLHSIPTLRTTEGLREITPELTAALRSNPPARIVYLSTTGVYGEQSVVDETTEVAPRTERERLRAEAEQAVRTGPWTSLILRPAAIYGPGRGIHASMRAGLFQLSENPSNYVSRIHVDDLAAQTYAALLSDHEGSYPVADEEPCTSLEAAQFCANLLDIPLPVSAASAALGETRRADRRVNGCAIRKILNVPLIYPSYKAGFPACLAAEMS